MSDSRPCAFVDPRAGQRDAFHQERHAVDAVCHRFEILEPVELSRLEMPGGSRCLDDHFHDRRREPHHVLDRRAELARHAGRSDPATRGLALGCAAGSSCESSRAKSSTMRGKPCLAEAIALTTLPA